MLERLKEKKAECLKEIAELKGKLDKATGKYEVVCELIEEEEAVVAEEEVECEPTEETYS